MIIDFSVFSEFVNSIGLNLLILMLAFAPMSMKPLRRYVFHRTTSLRTLWAGAASMLVISVPMGVLDNFNGFQFDLRQPILTISAYFLGLFPALVIAAMATIARLMMGSEGLYFGLWSIAGSVFVGLVGRFYSIKLESFPVFGFIGMGIIASVIWLLTNLVMPPEIALFILSNIAPYMILTNAALTAFFGMIVLSSHNSYLFSRTIRKNAEATVSVLNSLPDPIIEVELLKRKINNEEPLLVERYNAATLRLMDKRTIEDGDLRDLFKEYTSQLIDNIQVALMDSSISPEFEAVLCDSTNEYRTFSVKIVNYTKSSEPPFYMAISLHDVTARHHLEQANFILKFRDTVTSVGNRAALEEFYNQSKKKNGVLVTLITINIIELFELNTSLGLKTTDILIADIANRLTHLCQKVDVEIGRLSGGSFGILLTDRDPLVIASLLEQIESRLSEPFFIDDIQLNPGIHVGFVSSNDLIFHELIASAKLSIRNLPRNANMPVVIADMDTLAYISYRRKIDIANELRNSLAYNLLSVHFQPIVDAKTGEIVKAEALVRWFHPTMGYVSPAEFIPIAESLGLISRLGLSIREQVVQQLVKWKGLGCEIDVSINVSPLELSTNGFNIRNLTRMLDSHGIEHRRITFEITESTMVQSNTISDSWFALVSKLDFKLAIDDFGIGYSSLSMLDEIDAQYLKIDKSLVDDIAKRSDRCEVLSHIVKIAHINNMEVVAEGIETVDQVRLLRGMNVDYIQGYYFHKPMNGRDLTKILTNQTAVEIQKSSIIDCSDGVSND